jgi:oxygen-independent coproporphyrinogen-3 oxidase
LLKTKVDFLKALNKEIVMRSEDWPFKDLETVYFGGGTPSLLEARELKQILEALRYNFNIAEDAEITLEANPENLNEKYLEELLELGFNRLSIGIQTYDEESLKLLNRAHNTKTARSVPLLARESGFNNISLDLMFALPEMNLNLLNQNLIEIISFKPEHVSVYGLTIEKNTAFNNWLEKGKITELSQDEQAEQYHFLVQALEEAGYEHYEISNFALGAQRSKHNTSYWLGKPYLGLGPSAHSYDGDSRSWNVANTVKYIKSLEQSVIPKTTEVLSLTDKMNDFLLTRLRLKEGFEEADFKSAFGDANFQKLIKSTELLPDYMNRQNGSMSIILEKRIMLDFILSKLLF